MWVPDDFVPNGRSAGTLPKLSARTREVGGALRRMVSDGFHQKQLCFVLTLAEALKYDPHISPNQWAAKAGKPQGRNCIHCSWGGRYPGNQPLNSDALREWARHRWGHIRHPTIEDFVRMIVQFADEAMAQGQANRRIRIWKMDIAGAYTQLSYRAEDVHLMACSLPGDLVAFFTCGTFGWGAMPFAFHQITGAVVWELNEGRKHRLAGQCVMYVDDIAGVCFEDDLEADQGKAKTLVEGLLGIGSIADDKTEADRNGCLDFIGYRVDLPNKRVGITRANVCKALACAMAVGNGDAVDIKQMQRIASHASRYKRVCPLMAPFSHALYGACKQHPHDHVVFALTPEQMAAVWMMRILLLLTTVAGLKYTRTFDSFSLRDLVPEWTIEYDACLEGIAIIWFRRQPDGTEVAMGCYAASLKDMGLSADGSGRMNTAEFIAGTMGIRGLASRITGPAAVRVRGDNTSAMTWAEKSSFKSDYATRAAVVHVAQRVRSAIEVVTQEHLPHTREYDWNWRCDKVSRGECTWTQVMALDRRDSKGSRLDERMVPWEVEGDTAILALCNPNRGGVVDAAFVASVLVIVE